MFLGDTPIGVWDSRNERKSSFPAKYLKRKSEFFEKSVSVLDTYT